MSVLLFWPRFVAPIQAGTKRQTIRRSNRLPKPGGLISLRTWSGRPYHSSQVAILPPVRCLDLATVRFRVRSRGDRQAIQLELNGDRLRGEDLEAFARADGFEGLGDFLAYQVEFGFTDVRATVIRWAPPSPVALLDSTSTLSEVNDRVDAL